MTDKEKSQAEVFNKTMTSGFGAARDSFGSSNLDPLSRTVTSGISGMASPSKISGYLASNIDTNSEISQKLKLKL